MAEGIVHIAGPDITVGHQLRQRCAWCGAVLHDYDCTRIAVLEGDDPRPGTWPVGALVEVDGNAVWIRDHVDGDPLPANACGQIDHTVTGTETRAAIDDLLGRMADAILKVTYPPEEWPEGPAGEGEMDNAREEAAAALAVIEQDPVLEIRPYYPTQDAYDAACRALANHRERAERYRQLAAEILGHFTEPGHPGEPCRRTGWIRERTLAAWQAAAAEEQTPSPVTEGEARG